MVFVVGRHGGVLDRVEAIHCGADGHFTKPVDVGALVRRLRFLLERERAEPPRVLSVEDDPQQAAFLRTVLSSGGCEVRTVDDPLRLEAELAAFRPDLVLMDVLLPGVSGYDLVRSLRQDERYATLPVIILTTRGEMDARIEAARAGRRRAPGEAGLAGPAPLHGGGARRARPFPPPPRGARRPHRPLDPHRAARARRGRRWPGSGASRGGSGSG